MSRMLDRVDYSCVVTNKAVRTNIQWGHLGEEIQSLEGFEAGCIISWVLEHSQHPLSPRLHIKIR